MSAVMIIVTTPQYWRRQTEWGNAWVCETGIAACGRRGSSPVSSRTDRPVERLGEVGEPWQPGPRPPDARRGSQ
eukprot:scaffold4869_cov123-Isochrysis_galbana.AAC.10